MKDLLNFVNEHNFLKMGDYSFSPLMELSAGISLEYCKKINLDKCARLPLFLCFPEKGSASLWTAVSILTNYYFEDYINNEVDGINFIRGDKVKIFDCIAEIESVNHEKIILKFKDQGGIPINKRLRSYLSKINNNRSLSLKKKFSKNYSENKNKRNPISKILVPKDAKTINQNNLESKVLLIAGRGNGKNLHKLLNEVKIYDTSLSKIYPENNNLIIKPDLKAYTDLFDKEKLDQLLNFKKYLANLFDTIEIENAKIELKKINDKLEEASEISEELDEKILNFFNDYENELPEIIKFLEQKYPGIQEQLPSKLRAVVINDIHQINDYPNTIKGFLEKKIPVIFISNRNIHNNSDLDFYKRLFERNPNYFRINWNKKKINDIVSLSSETDFIDKGLWSQCKGYAEQTIIIDVAEGCELDSLAPQLFRDIKELDEFEILQKSFYQNFYPALFSLKNSINSNVVTKNLIEEFHLTYINVKNSIPLDIANNFEKAISLALSFQNNTKKFEVNDDIFAQIFISKSHEQLYIPAEANKPNIPSSSTDKIIFTGHPYSEYSGKYLLNASCVDYIKEIKILCWPNEASQTYSYLKRRISAGYFTDNVSSIVNVKEKYLLKNTIDFQEEINNYFNLTQNIRVEDETEEEGLEYIHTFKYKGYGVESSNFDTFSVKCDILNFEDGSFLFLPHRSKILAQTEDHFGKLKVSQRALSELSIGDNIYKYIKDRQAMRDMAKSDQTILSHFKKLEYWKDILVNIYAKCNSSVDELKLFLDKTKSDNKLKEGNPSKSSIRNWLFDDEFLKPENENLRIILLANKESNIDNKLQELNDSYHHVVSYTIGLSSQIKKQIKKQVSSKKTMDEDLKLRINGSEIIIQSRRIVSIDKNDMEVDYRNTRKILC